MKIALVQFAPRWEKPGESIITIRELLNKTTNKFDLIVFPELSLTGFTMNADKFAEEIDGISTKFFIELAQQLHTNIFAGLIEKSSEHNYNSLVHIDRNGLINARYRKIHPFSYADEDKHYTSLDEIVVTQIDQVKIGLSICYDLRFPELYRLYAKQGVEIIVNIANWPITRIEHWRTLLKARAIENQCFMIGVNRVGTDSTLQYNGYSSIHDPMGKEIVSISNEEKIIECEIDTSVVEEIRKKLPFLKDIKLI
ncbi:MAG: carbon-nitrogen family hydrolase [Bacteroidota bacterium]